MKKIKKALDQAWTSEFPSRKKWNAIIEWQEEKKTYYLLLFHRRYLILAYDLLKKKSLFQWHKNQTQKEALDFAIEYLNSKTFTTEE